MRRGAPRSALKGVVKIVNRHLAAGILVAVLLLGTPAAPPPPVHAESAEVVVLITPFGIVVITEGDPDVPDGTDQGPNYSVFAEDGTQIEVDHNWLSEYLFKTLGTWFDLSD